MPVVVVMTVPPGGRLRPGEPRLLVGQGQQRIPLGARETAPALLAGKERDEEAGEKQAAEYGDR